MYTFSYLHLSSVYLILLITKNEKAKILKVINSFQFEFYIIFNTNV
jgi:hypothetical protein